MFFGCALLFIAVVFVVAFVVDTVRIKNKARKAEKREQEATFARLALKVQDLKRDQDELKRVQDELHESVKNGKFITAELAKLLEDAAKLIEQKQDKLSSDDQFVADAKLSNSISSIAKHTAQKTLENALTGTLPTVARQELVTLLRNPEATETLVDNAADALTEVVIGVIQGSVLPIVKEQDRINTEMLKLQGQVPARDAKGRFSSRK